MESNPTSYDSVIIETVYSLKINTNSLLSVYEFSILSTPSIYSFTLSLLNGVYSLFE